MTQPLPHTPHRAGEPSHAEHKPGDLDFELPPPAQVSRTRLLGLLAMAGAVLGGAFLLRWIPNRAARAALAAESTSAEAAMPRVQIVVPIVVSSDRTLSLPGSAQPLEETILYPRVNGYIRKWNVDLGDNVKTGDLLAEIDTPDLDQQLAQARAQLAQADAGLLQARANARFSKANLERYQLLVPAGLASQQDFEQKRAQAEVDQAAINVSEATIGAQRANVQLLTQLKSFARITAPFDGRITVRNIERGALVSAGTASPLFKISAMDPVRVFIQVPQDVAPGVRVDTAAAVSIREYPGRTFQGKVARSAGSLDATTRTMNTEVRVANPDGAILTGMYATVALMLPTPHRVMSLPASALLNDANGLRVAIVDATDHVHLVPVVIERDTGPTVELSTGVAPGDRVVKLPTSELVEGRQVDVAKDPPKDSPKEGAKAPAK
jgi:RND family efflux transporter MFP subunit